MKEENDRKFEYVDLSPSPEELAELELWDVNYHNIKNHEVNDKRLFGIFFPGENEEDESTDDFSELSEEDSILIDSIFSLAARGMDDAVEFSKELNIPIEKMRKFLHLIYSTNRSIEPCIPVLVNGEEDPSLVNVDEVISATGWTDVEEDSYVWILTEFGRYYAYKIIMKYLLFEANRKPMNLTVSTLTPEHISLLKYFQGFKNGVRLSQEMLHAHRSKRNPRYLSYPELADLLHSGYVYYPQRSQIEKFGKEIGIEGGEGFDYYFMSPSGIQVLNECLNITLSWAELTIEQQKIITYLKDSTETAPKPIVDYYLEFADLESFKIMKQSPLLIRFLDAPDELVDSYYLTEKGKEILEKSEKHG